jgi:hypothetical protein
MGGVPTDGCLVLGLNVHFAFRKTPPLHLLSYWSVRSDMGTANLHVYIDNL